MTSRGLRSHASGGHFIRAPGACALNPRCASHDSFPSLPMLEFCLLSTLVCFLRLVSKYTLRISNSKEPGMSSRALRFIPMVNWGILIIFIFWNLFTPSSFKPFPIAFPTVHTASESLHPTSLPGYSRCRWCCGRSFLFFPFEVLVWERNRVLGNFRNERYWWWIPFCVNLERKKAASPRLYGS